MMLSEPAFPLEIATVSAPERRSAWAWLLGLPEGSEGDDPLVAAWQSQGEREPRFVVALVEGRRAGVRVGVGWLQPSGGDGAVCWFPRCREDEPVSTAFRLAQAALERGVDWGLAQVQALVPVDDRHAGPLLTGLDFQPIGELQYLVALLGAIDREPSQDALRWSRVGAEDGPRLAALVERTYQGTLDMPQLNGVRSAAQVLDEYRHAAGYDPALWWIAGDAAGDIGCLLLADDPVGEQCELVYMGIVPERRGAGLGAQLVRRARSLAAARGRERLVLGVAATNHPALEVYASLGFIVWEQRSVWIWQPGAIEG